MSALCVITANRTRDGRAVYLTEDRRWALDFASAARLEPELRESLLAWARTCEDEVCDPYDFTVGADGKDPRSARERIRAAGPGPVLRRLGYAA